MSSADKDRAERLFRQREDAPKALVDYRAKQKATRGHSRYRWDVLNVRGCCWRIGSVVQTESCSA
jgi:hypothetical protein